MPPENGRSRRPVSLLPSALPLFRVSRPQHGAVVDSGWRSYIVRGPMGAAGTPAPTICRGAADHNPKKSS
jgi:hypothetical protein